MRILIILLLSIFLCSCYTVKIKGTHCNQTTNVCTSFDYKSSKDHAEGVTFNWGDLKYKSNSSIARTSAWEEMGAGFTQGVLQKALSQLDLSGDTK